MTGNLPNSPTAFPFAAVLFDLDGVAVDTTQLHYRVWDEFARAHGHTPGKSDLLATNGRPAAEVIRQWLGASLDDGTVAGLTVERETLFHRLLAAEPLEAVAGVREYLAALDAAGVPKAVATSAVPANAERALARVGLADAFPVRVTAADVRRGKPDPEPYLTAAARLGVPADRCVVIEDSVSGVRAAKAAGAKCLALTTTFPRDVLEREGPDWLATDFREVPAALVPIPRVE